MKAGKIIYVYVGNSVSISQIEKLIAYIYLNSFYPAAGHGIEPRIDNCYTPFFSVFIMIDDFIILFKVKGNIRRVEKVVRKPLFDNMLFIAGTFASLTGAVGWLLSQNSFSGITYAALAICGMSFICALRGDQEALIVWGISIALTCAPLALHQVRNLFMNILAFMIVLCFSGLPYTPNALGWFGLIHEPFMIRDIVFILVMAFLIGGAFLHIFRSEGRKFSELEPWMRSVYPIGFVTAIATHVFIGMTGFRQQFSPGVIPCSAAAFIVGILLVLSVRFMPESRRTQNTAAWGQALISIFWSGMQRLMDMDWLIFIGRWAGRAVRKVFLSMSMVLENNGGLIWEFLLLVLLIASVFGGGLL